MADGRQRLKHKLRRCRGFLGGEQELRGRGRPGSLGLASASVPPRVSALVLLHHLTGPQFPT